MHTLKRGSHIHIQTACIPKGIVLYECSFATHEAIMKHITFDLEKALAQLNILHFSHIFRLGGNGKCWQLINDWYTDTFSIVKVHNKCSDSFQVSHDIKQGLAYSPTLHIAMMDSLLSFLKSSVLGLTLCRLNAGNSVCSS